MKFRTELHLKPLEQTISYQDQICLLGSCFAEHIGGKLQALKYRSLLNPLGIIYHPYPLHQMIHNALTQAVVQESDLEMDPEGKQVYWGGHGSLCSTEAYTTMQQVNDGLQQLKKVLSKASHLIITYGSAYYYHHPKAGAVANCHKFPTSTFEKKIAYATDIIESFNEMMSILLQTNPNIQVLLTVSPVRHIRDGIVENTLSKAQLITAIYQICSEYRQCQYIPAYELLMDDLRDYRFYSDDLVHPSHQAIDYIWEKVSEMILSSDEMDIRSQVQKIITAANHRPRLPHSAQHLAFCTSQIEVINILQKQHPYIDMSEEIKKFEFCLRT